MISSSPKTEWISASRVAKPGAVQGNGCTNPRPAGSGMASSLASIWIVIGRWAGWFRDQLRMSSRQSTKVGQVER
jgi:hypothetical protein